MEDVIKLCRGEVDANGPPAVDLKTIVFFVVSAYEARIPDEIFSTLKKRLTQSKGDSFLNAFKEVVFLEDWYIPCLDDESDKAWLLSSQGVFQKELSERQGGGISKYIQRETIIRRILYHLFSLCEKEGLIEAGSTESYMKFELQSCVKRVINLQVDTAGNNVIAPTLERPLQPILVQRRFADIGNHVAENPGPVNYLDYLPSKDGGQAELDVDLWEMLEKLTTSLTLAARDGASTSAFFSYKTLWRHPNGIDQEFHADYLDQICSDFIEACQNAIDARAKTKLELFVPAQIADASFSCTVDPAALNTVAWTEAWDSFQMATFLAGYGSLNPAAVEAMRCYLEDDGPGSEVPFLIIHNLGAEEFKGANGLRPVDPVADGVAAEVVCRLMTQQPGILLIARFLHSQVSLQSLLEGIRLQVSVALQAKLPHATTLPALLHSISLNLPAGCERCVVVLAGIGNIRVAEGAASVVFGRAHVPQHLPPRLKLLLTLTLDEKTAERPEQSLPLCLRLQLPSLHEADLLRLIVGRGPQPLARKQRDLAKRSLIPLAAANDLPQALALAHQLAGSFTLTEAASSEVNGSSNLHDALRLCQYVDFGLEGELIALTAQRLLRFASDPDSLGLHPNEFIDLFTGLITTASRTGVQPVGSANWQARKAAPNLGRIYFALFGLARLRLSTRYSEPTTRAVDGHIVYMPESVPGSCSGRGINSDDRELQALQLAYIERLTQEHSRQSAECQRIDVRHLLQLHRGTLKLGLYERLCMRYLFNFAWIRRVCIECTLEGVLRLYDSFISITACPASVSRGEMTTIQMQARLVRDVVAARTCQKVQRTQSLAVELLGRLLTVFNPSDNSLRFLTNLILRCSSLCTRKLGLLPRMPFPRAAGDPLLTCLQLPSGSLDSWVMVKRLLLMKTRGNSLLYELDLDHGDKLVETELCSGSLHVSQKHIIVVDDLVRSAINVYRLCNDNNAHQITYQYTLNPHKSLNDNIPGDEKRAGVCTVLCLDVMGEFLGIVLSTPTQMKLTRGAVQNEYENENLSPLTHNIVAVYHLHEGDLIFVTCPRYLATFVKIYPNSVDPWNPIIFTNSGDKLALFSVNENTQLAELDLQARPIRMLFSRHTNTAFLLTEEPRKLIFLRLAEDGTVKSSFRVSFQKVIPEDVIVDIALTANGQLLLIQALEHLIVYEVDSDEIVFLTNILTSLQQACIPECYFNKCNICDALLAYDDSLVVAAVHNLVLVWSIENERPVCVLKAEPTPITRLTISLGRNDCYNLIGYCEASRRIYIWDLETALKFSDLPDEESDGEEGGLRLSYPDIMAGPIKDAVQVGTSIIAVACHNSETVHLVDGSSCEIVDWIDTGGLVEALLTSSTCPNVIAGITVSKKAPAEKRWRLFDLSSKEVLYEAGMGARLLMSQEGFIEVGSKFSPDSKCEFRKIVVNTDARISATKVSTERMFCGLEAGTFVATADLDSIFNTRDGRIIVLPMLHSGKVEAVDLNGVTQTFDRVRLEAELARNEICLQVDCLLDCKPSVDSCIILLFTTTKPADDTCAAHFDLKEGQLTGFLPNLSAACADVEEACRGQLVIASNLCFLYNRQQRRMYSVGDDGALQCLHLPWAPDLPDFEFVGFCEDSQAAVFYSGSLLLLADPREDGRERAHVDCGGGGGGGGDGGIVFVSLLAQNILVGCRNGALFSFAVTLSETGEAILQETRLGRRRSIRAAMIEPLELKFDQDRRRSSLEELRVES
ncbi:hypothetical protein AAHC03_017031 [Spirometra sp. Aus1]